MSESNTGASASPFTPENTSLAASAESSEASQEAIAAEADAVEGAEESTDAESPAPAAKAAPKKEAAKASAKKKYQLKVDGREEELELDLDNEEEIKKHLQLSKAAQKRMQEMAEYKKNVAAFFDTLKNDPLKVLTDPNLGLDMKRIAEMVVNNEVEELKKSPEQREKEKLQRELEAIKKQHEDEKKARAEAEFARIQEQEAVRLDNEITSALDTSGLPKSAYTVKKMAEYMMLALQNNIDLSAKDVVPLLKKQTLAEVREMIGLLPEDMLEDFIGKENISRVRKRSLAKLKETPKTVNDVKPAGNDVKKVEEKAKPKIEMKDWLKSVGKW